MNWKTLHMLLFFLTYLTLAKLAYGVEIFFTPGPACENAIMQAIKESKIEIRAAVYSINNKNVVDALIDAKKRGVKVRVLTDRTQAAGRSSKVLDLISAGVDLRVHSKFKIEHNKFGVFDNRVAVNGSWNWTEPASKANSENCAVMPEANAVTAYKSRFEALWELNTEARSKKYVEKLRQKRRSVASDK